MLTWRMMSNKRGKKEYGQNGTEETDKKTSESSGYDHRLTENTIISV